MAVQIAVATGAKVIATASTPAKLEIARRFGASGVVNYAEGSGAEGKGKWWDEVLSLTGGEGVDVVFDSVGLVSDSLRCLKQRGRVLVVGFAGREGDLEVLGVNRVLLRQAQVIGYRFGMTDRIDPKETEEIWKRLKSMWEKGLVKPTVFDREYRGLESVVDAMKDLSARKVWGKAIVLLEDEETKPRL